MDVVAEIGGNPASKTRFSLSVENELGDAGRDDRTRLVRPSSQTRIGTTTTNSGEFIFFPVQLITSEQDWQPPYYSVVP